MLSLSRRSVIVGGLAWRAQGYGMAKDVSGFKSLSGSLNFYSADTLEDTRYV